MKPKCFAVLFLVLAAACSPSHEGKPTHHKQTQPITHKQAQAFAQWFDTAVKVRDVTAINRAFDLNLMFERAVRGMNLSAEERQWFLDTHRRGFDAGAALAGVLGDGGSYTLLWVHEVEGQYRALFRVIEAQGRLRYHDYLLGPGPNGDVVIADFVMLDQGESSGEVLRRHIEFARSDGARPTLGQAINELQTFNHQRRYAEALHYWERLDRSIREKKPVMSIRAFCAARVNGEALDEAVRDYLRLFPGDPGADLVTNEMLLRRGRHEAFLESIDRIRRAVGEDPHLDVLAAGSLRDMGRIDEARARVDAAIAAEPTLDRAHFTRLPIALDQEDYEAVAQTIAFLTDELGHPMPDLSQHEEFAGFVRSDAYRSWTAAQVATE